MAPAAIGRWTATTTGPGPWQRQAFATLPPSPVLIFLIFLLGQPALRISSAVAQTTMATALQSPVPSPRPLPPPLPPYHRGVQSSAVAAVANVTANAATNVTTNAAAAVAAVALLRPVAETRGGALL